jgi:Ca2+-binding RTX toxin-like protein
MTTSVALLNVTSDNVQKAYIAYFGRPADPAGLNFWVSAGTANTTMLTIMRDFGNSAEFKALYTASTDAAFVNQVYLNVFGRNADASGLNFYANGLASGTVTRADVVFNILNGAQGTDATIVANKVAFSQQYTAQLAQNVQAFVNYDLAYGVPEARQALSKVTATTTASEISAGVAASVTVVASGGAPTITSAAAQSVAENTTAVAVVKATDPEGQAIAYEIAGGADAALFTINPTTGTLSFKAAPNFESPADANADNVYVVAVKATDTTGRSNTQTMSVSVTDVNEAPTAVALSGAATAVAENSATTIAVKVADVVITDDKLGTNTVTLSGADAAKFEVVGGALRIKSGTVLDFETQKSLTVTVSVSDSTVSGAASVSTTLTLAITDGNDAPTFAAATATISVAENTTAVTAAGGATDVDTGTNGTITYSLAGTDAAKFNINATTGALSFKTAPNFEVDAKSYSVTVVATDGGGLTASQAVTINVTDVNEAPTAGAAATATVAENTTAVGTFAATDVDAGDTLTYTLTGADAATFNIAAGGVVSFKAAPNFEVDSKTYAINVVATDKAGLASTQAVTVNVMDVNEAPVVSSAATGTVAENAAASTVIYTVTSTDDAGDTATYSIAGGTDAALVDIDSKTGAVTLKSSANFEAKSSYSFNVVATDKAGLVSAPKAVVVNVTDVNEAPVGVADTSATADNTSVTIDVLANDMDVDAGTKLSIFSATNGANGTVSIVDNKLVYKPNATFLNGSDTFEYVAQDAGGLKTAATKVTVTVNTVNTAPVITPSQVLTINENLASGTSAGFVAATDEEGNGVGNWTITGGTGASLFSINKFTGEVTSTASFDFETKGSYTLTVQASDTSGLQSKVETLTVNVKDVNEAPTAGAAATASVAENTAAVGTFAAADVDAGDALTYTLTGADAAKFNVAAGGVVTFKAAPNFEVDAKSYSINVVATDKAGLSSTQAVTVNVTDVNEAPTAGAAATPSVAENTTAVGTFAATDVDAGDVLTYTLTGADAAKFNVAAGGVLSFKTAPNFEVDAKSYSVNVVATDKAGLTSTQAVTISLTDVNEAPTAGAAATASVAENTTAVGTFAAADVDAGDALTYTLTGADAAKFDVAAGGVVTFKAAPNFEVDAKSYSINVVATDKAGLSSTQAVTVNVTDVNEAPTAGAAATPSVAENTTAVGTFAATDVDAGDVLTYTLTGADAAKFNVAAGGVLSFKTAPNFEVDAKSYSVNVVATDKAGLTSTQAVTISLTDVNEAPTAGAAATASVAENTTAVGTFAAADVDAGDALTYTLTGADAAKFNVAAGGVVTFKAAPNFEVDAKSYSINVVATDKAGLSSTQAVTVNVTNVDEAPVLTVGSTTPSQAENTIAGTAITTFNAVDPEGAAVTYSLTGDDAALFQITGNSLSFLKAPDFEVPTDVNKDGIYLVNVVAKDPAGNTDTKAVTVTVTNVNETTTFSLTTGTNSGTAFTGSNEISVFDGSVANSLNTSDTLAGGTGTSDSLNANLSTANQVVRPTLSGIESVTVTAAAGTGNSTTVDLASSTGYTSLSSQLSTSGLTFDNIGVGTLSGSVVSNQTNIAAAAGDGTVTYKYTDAALAGAADSLSLTVTGFGNGGGNDEVIAVTRAAGATNALETVSISGSSLANNFTLDVSNSGVKTLVVAGSVGETVKLTNPASLTSIDASTSSGANGFTLANAYSGTVKGGTGADEVILANATNTVTVSGVETITANAGNDSITVTDAAATTIVAGAGNDKLVGGNGNTRFDLTGGFDANDTVTAGTGADTLRVASADAAGLTTTKVTGIETLSLTGALAGTVTTANISSGITTVTLEGGIDGGTVAGGSAVTTVNLNAATGAAGGTFTGSNVATATDSVTVNNGAAATNVLANRNLTFTDLESVTITTSGTGAATAQTVNTVAVNPTTGKGATVTLSGSNKLTAASVSSNTTGALVINASGITSTAAGAVTINNIVAATATSVAVTGSGADDVIATTAAASIDGGAGADQLTGGVNNDTLIGGAGNDVLTAGGGVDSLVGGADDDTFVFAAATNLTNADKIDGGTGTNVLKAVAADVTGYVTATNITNVQTLQITDALAAATYDASKLSTGINKAIIDIAIGNAATITGNAGAFEVNLTQAATSNFSVTDTGTATTDSLTLVNSGVATTNFLGGQNVTITGYETVNLKTTEPGGATTQTVGTLALNPDTAGAQTLNVSGTNSFSATSITSNTTGTLTIDGSQLATGKTVLIGGITAATATSVVVTGSGAGDNITTVSAASIDGGAGADQLTGGANNDTLIGGAGNDVLTAGAGVDSLVGGADDDTFVFAAATNLTNADKIDGGTGTNVLKAVAADVTGYVTATNITNVQTLQITDALAAATYDASKLSTGINKAIIDIAIGNAATITGNAGAFEVNLTQAATSNFSVTDTGTATTDSLTLVNSGVATTNFLGGQNVTITGYETVNLKTTEPGGATTQTVGTLALNPDTAGAQTLNVSGTNSFNATSITSNTTGALTIDGSQLATGKSLTIGGITATTATSVSVVGSGAADVITGGAASETYSLGTGDNVTAAGGNDTVNFSGAVTTATVGGGAGNDTITFAAAVAAVTIDGGADSDTVTLTSGTNALSDIQNVESITGGTGNDTVTFTTVAVSGVSMSGGGGSDVINLSNVGANTFTYTTGGSTTTINGSAQNDTITVSGSGTTRIIAGGGTDKLTGGSGSNTYVFGGGDLVAADTIVGGAGADTVEITAAGAVTMTNVSSVETVAFLNANAGSTVTLSAGVTTITGDDANDQVLTLGAAQTTALAVSLGTKTGGGDADTLTLATGADNTGLITVTGAETVTGGQGSDKITVTTATVINADTGTNVGLVGNDSLTGSSGNDTFVFAGNLTAVDTIIGGGGTDTIKYTNAGAANTSIDLSGASAIGKLDFTAAYTGSITGLSASSVTTVSGGGTAEALTIVGAVSGVTFSLGGGGDSVQLASNVSNSVTVTSLLAITGGDGSDTVNLKTGATGTVDGGIGSDTVVFADAGIVAASIKAVETITGSTGADTITSLETGTGGTSMTGSGGLDTVTLANAGTRSLTFTSTGGTLAVTGSAGSDTITVVGTGAATITGTAGNDKLTGGSADDRFDLTIAQTVATTTLDGGLGTDTLRITDALGGLTADLTNVSGIENLTLVNVGNTGSITYAAGTSVNSITGSSGADTVTFGGTALNGVTVNGGGGADAFTLANATNVATFTNTAQFSVTGGTGADTITIASGVTSAVSISGGTGADTISAGGGADTVLGGDGADRLSGNAGADVFQYQAVSNSSGSNVDTITDFTAGTDTIVFTVTVPTAASSTNANKFIATNIGALTTTAFSGSSPLTNQAGEVLLFSDTNQLVLDTNGDGVLNANDYRINLSNVTTSVFTSIAYSVTGNDTGNNTITGGGLADTLVGGTQADVITGGGGADSLTGNAGADTFVFGATAAANGADIFTDLTVGAGGDVLDFSAFAIDGNATATAPGVFVAADTANPGASTDIAGTVRRLVDIAGAQDITTAAGLTTALAAGGEYANIDMAANSKAIIIVSATGGADADFIFFATSDAAGVISVTLVGTTTNNVTIGNYVAGNFLI